MFGFGALGELALGDSGSFNRNAAAAGVSVALTAGILLAPALPIGVSIGMSAGTLSDAESPQFNSVVLSLSAGSLKKEISPALAGIPIAVVAGALQPLAGGVATGVSVTLSPGVLGTSLGLPLSGTAISVVAGNLRETEAISLLGVSSQLSAGNLAQSSIEMLSGVSMSMIPGSFFEGLFGAQTSLIAGNLSEVISTALTGANSSLIAGELSESLSSRITLLGVNIGALSAGNLSASSIAGATLFGVQINTAVATFGVAFLDYSGIDALIQAAEMDDEVELYIIDATPIGGSILRVTSSAESDGAISFGGNQYDPIPVEGSGWEKSSSGTLPTPSLRVSNVSRAFGAEVIAFDDLRGAIVTRIRTFRRYLDGSPYADPFAYLPLDIYSINRKTLQTNSEIEWELAAPTDQRGVYLPKRPILRNACTHRYRRWNATTMTYDYTKATCPYAAPDSFDTSGAPTDSAHDQCGKKLSDCKVRFGNDPLPTRAFPGVARV